MTSLWLHAQENRKAQRMVMSRRMDCVSLWCKRPQSTAEGQGAQQDESRVLTSAHHGRLAARLSQCHAAGGQPCAGSLERNPATRRGTCATRSQGQ